MVPIETCPICGNHQLKPFLQVTDFSVTHEESKLLQCTDCQLLATSPQPLPTDMGRYYDSDQYISHTGNGNTLLNKAYLLARNFTIRQKVRLIGDPGKKGKLLDYGSGTGAFLRQAQKAGWETWGIEPSTAARTKSPSLTVVGDLKDCAETGFNVITLWHVLEHVHNPTETIRSLRKRLAPNGKILIAVPNYKSFDATHYQQYWAAYDVPRHLWHFSQKSMNLLMQKNGLTVRSILPMRLDAYYVSLLSERYKKPSGNRLKMYLSALFTAWKSNTKARKTSESSSLIYIIGP